MLKGLDFPIETKKSYYIVVVVVVKWSKIKEDLSQISALFPLDRMIRDNLGHQHMIKIFRQ